MGTRRLIISAKVLVLACVALVAMQIQRPDAAAAAGGGQAASQAAPARGGGQRGGGRADAPTVGPGTLMTGVWGADPTAVDSRGWGWMTQVVRQRELQASVLQQGEGDCCSAASRSPATRSARSIRTFYCEVRKHYGFVWFEMQHSTMSWDNVAKMIAACPGPDGAAPMIRMPDQLESSIQKATDLGAIGLIFPTMRDGHQALEAARYSRFPPFGRRSSGSGQAGSVWAERAGRLPEHLQRQHARRRDARNARRHHQRGRDREHVRHRRRHPGQQRSVALLRVGADRPAIPVAADGQPQCDAPRRQVLGQRGRSSTSPAIR